MVVFSDHALRKMEQRHLKKEWVLAVLDKPDYVAKGYSERMIAYRKIEKLYLAVVYTKENGSFIVVTAHWEKGFKPKKEA